MKNIKRIGEKSFVLKYLIIYEVNPHGYKKLFRNICFENRPTPKKCYFAEIDDETKENPLGLEER